MALLLACALPYLLRINQPPIAPWGGFRHGSDPPLRLPKGIISGLSFQSAPARNTILLLSPLSLLTHCLVVFTPSFRYLNGYRPVPIQGIPSSLSTKALDLIDRQRMPRPNGPKIILFPQRGAALFGGRRFN